MRKFTIKSTFGPKFQSVIKARSATDLHEQMCDLFQSIQSYRDYTVTHMSKTACIEVSDTPSYSRTMIRRNRGDFLMSNSPIQWTRKQEQTLYLWNELITPKIRTSPFERARYIFSVDCIKKDNEGYCRRNIIVWATSTLCQNDVLNYIDQYGSDMVLGIEILPVSEVCTPSKLKRPL